MGIRTGLVAIVVGLAVVAAGPAEARKKRRAPAKPVASAIAPGDAIKGRATRDNEGDYQRRMRLQNERWDKLSSQTMKSICTTPTC